MTLYAAVPGELIALSGGEVLWRRHDDAERRVLDPAEALVLAECTLFARREQHLARLARAGTGLAGVFDALIGRGLLAGPAAFLPAPGEPPAPLPEPLLVVRVWQRPEGLARLLDSLAAEELRWGKRHRLVLVDDTREAAHALATRELAARHATRRGAPVGLLGPAQREQALARWLGGFDPDTTALLRGLLDPDIPSAVTGSRSWNLALLLAAGGALGILDDDVEFPLRQFPQHDSRFELADSTEAVLRFHDEPAAMLAAPPLEEESYAWLASWFGRDAGAWLAARGAAEDALPQRQPAELLALARRPHVLGVVPGLYGGLAFDSSVYLTYSNPASQVDLWRAPYRAQRLEGDRLWHGYPRPRLTTHAVYTPALLDARALLPFAGTWGRVDDTLFLSALRAIEPGGCFVHVGAMLGHRDLAPRGRMARARGTVLLDRNAFLAHLVDTLGQGLQSGTRPRRLATLGLLLGDLADATDSALARAVVAFRAHMQGRIVAHLDAALARHPEAPAAWREHAAAIVRANRAALVDERVDAGELALTRRAIGQYAAAAAAWPRLWDRAAAIGAGAERHPLCEWLA